MEVFASKLRRCYRIAMEQLAYLRLLLKDVQDISWKYPVRLLSNILEFQSLFGENLGFYYEENPELFPEKYAGFFPKKFRGLFPGNFKDFFLETYPGLSKKYPGLFPETYLGTLLESYQDFS